MVSGRWAYQNAVLEKYRPFDRLRALSWLNDPRGNGEVGEGVKKSKYILPTILAFCFFSNFAPIMAVQRVAFENELNVGS